MRQTKILYHGSSQIIRTPQFGVGRVDNDYGQGFYCTESLALAKEWACSSEVSGFANKYQMSFDGLKILNLSDEGYTILHWMAILLEHRRIRISTPIMREGMMWLKEHYAIDLSPYDVIIGYRADDAYFSFARAFMSNMITVEQLSYALHLGKLGEQIVLKSEKAFQRIRFVSSEKADAETYYTLRVARDQKARAAFERELEKGRAKGTFLQALLEKGG